MMPVKILNNIYVKMLKEIFEKKDYTFFEGKYNLNIIGIRTSAWYPDKFGCYILQVYQNEYTDWCVDVYEATTIPGRIALLEPMHSQGTGILIPQQVKGLLRIGKHHGRNALIQRKVCIVARDNDRDNYYDLDDLYPADPGCGFNLHNAPVEDEFANFVGKFSYGCQVIADNDKYKQFMGLCERSAALYGNAFTYTLLDAKDFDTRKLFKYYKQI